MMKIRFLAVAVAIVGLAFFGGCGGETPDDASVDSTEVKTVVLGEIQTGTAGAVEVRLGAAARAEDSAGEDGLFGGTVLAEVRSGGGDQPKIELEMSTFEMGVIANDKVAHAEMKVYNRGTAPLRIGKVKTTCGCTTGNMRNDVILPGETGILDIHVDPAKIPGYFANKTLTLSSNDPSNPTLRVQVATHVEPEAEFTPMEFQLGDVAHGEAAEGVLHARQLQKETMEFLEIAVRRDSPYITASFELVPEEDWQVPGKAEYTVRAKLSPDAPAGRYNELIYLKTNIKRQRRISLPFKAVIQGVYSFRPTRVSLRNIIYGQNYVGVLSVSSKKELEILEVSNSNESVQLSHRPGNRPNTHVFDVVIPGPTDSPLQKDTWTLRLKADGEEFTENIDVSLVMARGQ